jgi:hypothetical protein
MAMWDEAAMLKSRLDLAPAKFEGAGRCATDAGGN